MAVTGVTTNPQVYKLGGAWEERYAYEDDEVFAAGDLIRLSDAGTIQMADTTAAGSVQGMALETGADTDGSASPVLMFAPDTIIKIQCIDGEAPADLTKGLAYDITVATGTQSITATTDASSIAMVVGYAADAQPWSDAIGTFDEDSTVDSNSVHISFMADALAVHVP